jgi:hypothetical protein
MCVCVCVCVCVFECECVFEEDLINSNHLCVYHKLPGHSSVRVTVQPVDGGGQLERKSVQVSPSKLTELAQDLYPDRSDVTYFTIDGSEVFDMESLRDDEKLFLCPPGVRPPGPFAAGFSVLPVFSSVVSVRLLLTSCWP